ncbi:hypothetical protein [Kitasatospora phosalacinea]|uniref:Uncharacterized protein n=1 Tax=Kitasatospora phosalacinea TaxID=2065 RepID=A0ABW6GR99_9ACTN
MSTLADRVPLALCITRYGLTRARVVAAIPTLTPGLYVAWSSNYDSYAIVHNSGLTVAYGWDRAHYAVAAAEDLLVAEAIDWTGSPEKVRAASYQTIHDVAAAITQHYGKFVHSLA